MPSSLSSKRKKKAAPSAASSLRVHVRVAASPSRDSDPIVCSFPGGFPQSLQPKFTWHGNRVVGQDAACYYFASSSEPKDEGSPPPATKLCVGVYDKHTGQLTLHPAADNGRVFCLQQRVAQYQSNSSNNRINNSSEIRGAAAQYRALFEDFGSAKKRKVLRSQRANQVEAVVGLGVTSSQPGATMSESNRQALAKQRAALAAAQAAAGDESGNNSSNRQIRLLAPSDGVDAAMAEMRQRFLPKFNAAAEHPVDVYDAEDMASHEGWAHVSRLVTACWHKDDVVKALTQPRPNQHFNNNRDDTSHTKPTTEHDTWNASVKLLLYKIPDDCQSFSKEQASTVQRKLKCALVLNHWIHLWNRLHRKRFIPAPDDARHSYFGHPRALAVRFLERFGTPTVDEQSGEAGYAFSQANRDSCHVHLFLLYMMADYHGSSSSATTALWADNIQPLASDLRVDAADAIKLLRQAGCTVQRGGGGGKSDNNKIAVVLKTPLTFPKTQKSAAARR